MKLSTCIVVRNEGKLLEHCLKSVKGIADEIVVVHDGPCSDGSLTVAAKFGAKVYTQSFVGEAEHYRPFSYQQAKGDWILQIDADEFLSETAKKEIPELIKNKHVDAYSFCWPYFIAGEYVKRGPFAKTFKPCLFRKEKMFMIGISHEYPRTYGVLKRYPGIRLEHRPYSNNYTKETFRNKWMPWAKLQAEQIYKIETAPTFGIPDLQANPIYQYYVSMRKFPILTGIKETLKFILIYLTRGLLWSNITSFKIALFELSYLWLVRVYLLSFKHGRRI